jgi:hypothetical protein
MTLIVFVELLFPRDGRVVFGAVRRSWLSDSSKAYCLATLCTGFPPSRRLFGQVKIKKGTKGVVAVPLTRIIQPTSRWKFDPGALEGSKSQPLLLTITKVRLLLRCPRGIRSELSGARVK